VILPVKRASELSVDPEKPQWLIQDLWAEQAVGVLGGEPKCCKSFLALDIAVSVATATPCLRHFPVLHQGRVLLYPAEDSLSIVRNRLDGICRAANTDFSNLDLHVITAPRVLLDSPDDRKKLSETIHTLQPTLLVLDPFIRLHQIDENMASEVSPILAYLRQLQKHFHMAILLVHHTKKGAQRQRPGQALRGSSDLHGWGDSNLYLRRKEDRLSLTVEHRAAPSQDDIHLELSDNNSALALNIINRPIPESPPEKELKLPPSQRISQALASLHHPVSFRALRELCHMRAATLGTTLCQMVQEGTVKQSNDGYYSPPAGPFPVSVSSVPIANTGNGNGKH